MLPVSYNTFGFTAIIFMVVILVIAEAVKHIKSKKSTKKIGSNPVR
jgi:hypothetical protein